MVNLFLQIDKTAVSSAASTVITVPVSIKAKKQTVKQDLISWKVYFGDKKVEHFYKAFQKIAADPSKSDVEITATFQSIKKKLPKVFGVQNDFFATTFYYYLSNGYHGKEITLPDFISKFKAFNSLLKKDLYNF